MLDSLKFVQGSVAKKDLLPALTHFVIEGGNVRGYNGTIALSSPIDVGIECKPRADALVRAIGQCKDVIQLTLTAAGKLTVKSGKFKAYVECVQGPTPHVLPTGQDLWIDCTKLFETFELFFKLIGDDASRPWTNGMLLRGQSAYVTNNVVIAERWLGFDVPTLNIPAAAIKEVIRCKEAPKYLQYDESSVTFHYENGRWIRTQLLSSEWPDLSRIFNAEANPTAIDPAIFEACAQLKPFTDKLGRVYFFPNELRTHEEDGLGAVAAVESFNQPGAYALEMLELLDGVAEVIDWSLYPRPCIFYNGSDIRGAIVGVHINEK